MVGGDLSRDSMAVPITVLKEKGANYNKVFRVNTPQGPAITPKTDLNRDNRILNTVVKQN
jgi:hypothetical protein